MKKVLFVCVGNSCRSQIAEGFAKHLGNKELEIKSAGTKPALAVSGKAEKVMAEKNVDISNQHPKPLSNEDIQWADRIVVMGCGVELPEMGEGEVLVEDWGIDDPIGQPVETYREVRDQIEKKVREFLEKLEDH
jgi:arsenate reductase